MASQSNALRFSVGTSSQPITDPNKPRPNVAGPVYWLCIKDLAPYHAKPGDLVWNKS